MKTCKYCGKLFKQRHGRQTYCSIDCLKEANRSKAQSRYSQKHGLSEKTKTCPVCEKSFTSASNVVKYCCSECAQEANRRNGQIKYWKRKTEQPDISFKKTEIKQQAQCYFCDNCGRQFLRTGKERFCPACSNQQAACHA